MSLALKDKISGALTGAVIGAELGFIKYSNPQLFSHIRTAADLFSVNLEPDFDWKPQQNHQWAAKLIPLIALGVNAYCSVNGRVTPEVFGKLFRDDKGIATPAFSFDGLHSIQELLSEGMHPRLSGLHHEPSGLICACMPATGIFHFGDPERAYLDGVELASVAQPRAGADWAGLCAAAIAASFESGASPESVVGKVMEIAHFNSKNLFYELEPFTRNKSGVPPFETMENWWFNFGGIIPLGREGLWVGHNPIRYVVGALSAFGNEPSKMIQALVCANHGDWLNGAIGGHTISAIIAGAVVGAIGGKTVFPERWRKWAEPKALPWGKLTDVVENRIKEEKVIVKQVESLLSIRVDGASLLHDKIKGAILAGAIGNAMGSPVEGKLFTEIDSLYPQHVTTILEPGRLESEDDNQMAMLLVETYIERNGLPVSARHFGDMWERRLNRSMFFPACMGNSYDLIRQGVDPRITGHWNRVTGSTVMCMEPVGMYNIADPVWASQDATAISYMYQRGLDVTAAAMLAATVANALRGDATVDSVCQAALDVAPRTPAHTFDKRKFESAYDYIEMCLDIADKYTDVLAARRELYDECLLYHMIDPLELWGFALAMFKIAKGDVRQAAIGGTNIGRDSDTIAGRASMLSGALKGCAGVPHEWIAMFKQNSIERIDNNAGRLTDLIGGRKTALARRRLGVA